MSIRPQRIALIALCGLLGSGSQRAWGAPAERRKLDEHDRVFHLPTDRLPLRSRTPILRLRGQPTLPTETRIPAPKPMRWRRFQRRAAPRQGRPRARQRLSRVLRSHIAQLQRCQPQSSTGRTRWARVELRITPRGEIRVLSMTGSLDRTTAQCIRWRIYRWRLRPRASARRYRFHVRFVPSQNAPGRDGRRSRKRLRVAEVSR